MRTGTRGKQNGGNCVVPIARKTGSFGVSSKLRKTKTHGNTSGISRASRPVG